MMTHHAQNFEKFDKYSQGQQNSLGGATVGSGRNYNDLVASNPTSVVNFQNYNPQHI